MGFESIRVELRGGTASFSQVDSFVRRLPNARPSTEVIPSRDSNFYTVEDGLHVIEIEVRAAPVSVSCRFTLCHPPSIDAAFLALVGELMDALGIEAGLCDEPDQECSHWFTADRFSEFTDRFLHVVATRRAEWVASFGSAQFPATTREVYERVILPRCEPVSETAR